jgi:hypothetical protein
MVRSLRRAASLAVRKRSIDSVVIPGFLSVSVAVNKEVATIPSEQIIYSNHAGRVTAPGKKAGQ